MSKISLKHSGGNVVSLNSPTNAPGAADVAFKLPNADGSNGQAIVTDGSGNLSFANAGGGRAHNLIINGSFLIAQRGVSSTSNDYQTVDRFRGDHGGTDEAPTYAQVDVASGTTPYTLGFRKAFKITNGNQTSGAGAGDYMGIDSKLEAQDIANSGWNYTSNTSYVTLSFWVKSSVAQNFYGYLLTNDGTAQIYPFETGSLSADTWTKVTKTISGNSNLTFNNDNGNGLQFQLWSYIGTTYTDSGVSLNQWSAYASGTRTPDNTSTWYTTNDSTLEITGVQLEVGSVASDFEHRSYAQELQLCKRYYQKWCEGNSKYVGNGLVSAATEVHASIYLPVTMRGTVAIDHTYGNDYWRIAGSMGGDKYIDGAWVVDNQQPNVFNIYSAPEVSLSSYVGDAGYIQGKNAASYMAFSSEL